ncbi:TetR/AcrR family transcriptional regulator [Paenibacillus sp. SYP-B3998]|uniref:TetR/AcrR family transcriptional regulator n=1 Tax=Paenibacillus sp. SYP-B3998 TaxID=2678564 RepID=A0A6G4A1Z7_9BACL|nr:TetR/AcrR family transcriptional regulator [Paenibacillus sp. SYP-B3998]
MKKRKPTNRDRTLQVATSLFLTKGYLATSMDEIVAVSKVSKTNIYYYFKSKEDLLSAILDQLIQTYTEMIHEVASRRDTSVQERFTALIQLLTQQELECLGGCPFLTLYAQMPQEAHQLREKVSAFFRDQVDAVEALLHEGIQKQEFKDDLPARATAQLIVSLIEGGLFLAHASKDTGMLGSSLTTLAFLLK